MRHCNNCKVDVLGDWNTCPLCHNPIWVNGVNAAPSPFPDIPLRYHKYLAIKILSFISIVTVVLSFISYQIWPNKKNWPLLVLFGVISMWLIVAAIIRKKNNIMTKGIVYQITLLSLLYLFWDYYTGWNKWSINYAIPMTYTAALISMLVAVKVVKLDAEDYMMYLLIAALLALLPMLFILFKWVIHPIPSFISVCLSVIMLSAIAIFRGGHIISEFQKRMHI